jgi:polyisoprenoid-binding protein YceI
MNIFAKAVVCASLLVLAKGIEAQTTADIPVIHIAKEGSSVRFAVKGSVSLEGTFDKWDATIAYPSRDAEAGVLDIKIQADSVNTGSGMKDDKLKSKDFFNVKEDLWLLKTPADFKINEIRRVSVTLLHG